MNAVTTVPQPSLGFAEMERLAVSIAKSGMFGMKTPEQALVLMAIAQAEGRHPALAARDYDVIQGKPAKKAEAMMRDFLEAGGKVEWHALTDTVADATFTHPQTGSVRIDWTLARANTAGLAGKSTWKQFPRQMLRSRVVSEGVRTLWPLATSGFYVPEEQADIPAAHPGQTIESTAADVQAAAPEAPPGSTAQPRARTRREFLDGLAIALRDAQSAEEVDRIVCGEEVMRAKEIFQNGHKMELDKLIVDALAKWWTEPTDEELGEVEIQGADKMAAG